MTKPKLILQSVVWLIRSGLSLTAIEVARRCLGSNGKEQS